jgi:hypothetical protein
MLKLTKPTGGDRNGLVSIFVSGMTYLSASSVGSVLWRKAGCKGRLPNCHRAFHHELN